MSSAHQGQRVFGSLTRIVLGLILLWAFFDKLFGWGFATPAERSWLNGGSPTKGFLANATSGPLAEMYQSMAGAGWVDWLFMVGLALIGLSLVLGIGVKIAGYSGALLMLLLWSAVLPPENNPVFDDHIVYALVMLWFTRIDMTDQWSLAPWWSKVIGKNKWLA